MQQTETDTEGLGAALIDDRNGEETHGKKATEEEEYKWLERNQTHNSGELVQIGFAKRHVKCSIHNLMQSHAVFFPC